jgi:hypothetical protein
MSFGYLSKKSSPRAWAIYALTCFLNLWVVTALAQTPLTVGIRLHRGFIIPHSDSIANLASARPFSLELDAGRHLMGQRTYDACQCLPRVGASFFYTNFGNPAVLGNAYSLLPYVEPYFRADKRFNFSFRFGIGVSYLNRVYDPVDNPLNLFYSSPISFLLLANLSANYKISPQITLRLAGNYNHISNGGLQDPNKGINYPTLSLGLDYTPRPPEFQAREPIGWRDLHPKRQSWQVAVFGMAKKAFRGEPNRFAVVGLSAQVRQVVGRIHALTLGAEYVADFSQRALAQRLGQPVRYQDLALLAGHEFVLGRFGFSQALGVYLVSHPNNLDPVYQRYGLSCRLGPRLGLGLNLKAHRNVADFLDFRLIYTVWRR